MDPMTVALFLGAALVIAITPGPGIFYVAARTLEGGRAVGIASSLGTGLGGFVHVVAGAAGVSALVLASAELFMLFKALGAVYLIYLGWRAFRDADKPLAVTTTADAGSARAFRDGVVVEALNPKTAAFFLAFIPQFVDPAVGPVATQFVVLGAISVVLNTGADFVVVAMASAVRGRMAGWPRAVRRLRQASAAVLCGLGISLTVLRRP